MSLDIAAIDRRAAELFDGGLDPSDRDQMIEQALPLAEHLARRFRGRGEPVEDLTQVAIKSVDRFDPSHEVRFSTYATPTILGEIKRHFRDAGWGVHLPRRLKERALALRNREQEMQHTLGRAPTVAELAADLGIGLDEVVEAMEAATAYSPGSLDATNNDDDESPIITLGAEDPAIELAEHWSSLSPHLAALEERDRTILYLRFVKELSQSEIAAKIGCSQMHVSRLLSRILANLRSAVEPDAPEKARQA
jgi:RNA polymerase sigma-B factor